MFRNRTDAGLALGRQLEKYRGANCIVLAIPKGGIPVGAAVAGRLELPLKLMSIQKIIHPRHKECAIGEVSQWGSFIMPHEDVSRDYVLRETDRIRQSLIAQSASYDIDSQPIDLTNRTVILTDDGIASGNTMIAAINIIRKSNPANIVVAVPVCSRNAYRKIEPKVAEMTALLVPEHFEGVSDFFEEVVTSSELYRLSVA